MAYAWAIPYNNPLAIIQRPADKWKGLVGSDNGKLKFDTMENGVRAGVINLYNGYFKRGNNTLIGIFERYAPKSDGNDPLNYANIVAKKIGVTIDKKLNFVEHAAPLARAIIQVESGKDITNEKFNKGLKLAFEQLGFKVTEGQQAPQGTPQSSGKITPLFWVLPILVAGFLIIRK